jgi:hypothetical protein
MKTPNAEPGVARPRPSLSGWAWPILAMLLLGPSSAQAQTNYAIDWSTIDGGCGTSTGNGFTVSGTIGQHDAGAMSGGNYRLQGGFWGIIAAVQTEGAPVLTIFRTATNTAVVCWPSPSTGWNPQQNGVLNTANWVTPPESINDNGTNKFIIVSPAAGNRFYRLHKP